MKPFAYRRALDAKEAVQAAHGAADASFLAGGTNLVDMMRLEVMSPSLLVDISRIPLTEITPLPSGGMRIGALVRNSTLAFHPWIKKNYPVLSQAILSGASPQIRNLATIGGNLMQRTRCPYFRDGISPCNKRAPGSGCSAIEGYHRGHAVLGTSPHCIATHPSDMCVALAALEAQIFVEGPQGARTIPVTGFHLLPGETPWRETALEPGEIITAIELPPLPEGTRSCYLKARDRASFEFALASVAVVLEMRGERISHGRIALGGVATKPWRVPPAEARLQGAEPSTLLFHACAQICMADAAPHLHNAYKVGLAERLVKRALIIASQLEER